MLEESGWISALVHSEMATAGTADSYLKAAHLKRTRHAHIVTVLTLSRLMNDAFLDTSENADKIIHSWL